MDKVFYTILLSLLYSLTQAQSWSPYQELYTDNQISVGISFRNSPTACEAQGISSKYRYRIKGKFYNTRKYVTWKMDYINCNGIKFIETNSVNIGLNGHDGVIESLDYTFLATELEKEIYDIATNTYDAKEKKEIKGIHSTLPKQILGSKTIYKGQSTTLSIRDGLLASGAEWKWYTDSCDGELAGTGSSITVSPAQTTRYYLKAMSNLSSTECIYAEIIVREDSKLPATIYGDNSICRGGTLKLSFVGGVLGDSSEWVWYEGECGGKEAGRGEVMTASPISSTTYYLSAEGPNGTNQCISKRIIVETPSTAPTSISGDLKSNICPDDNITLKVIGGNIGEGAQWVWYKNSIQPSNKAGMGASLKATLTTDIKYLVRAEGECNNTSDVSIDIQVLPPPEDPTDIKSETAEVYKGKKTTLRVLSFNDTRKFNWVWSDGKCGGKQIGTGEVIKYKFKAPTTISIHSTNTCGNSKCITKTFQPLDRSIINQKAEPSKNIQIGFELGANTAALTPIDKNTTSVKIGVAAEAGLIFHPLFKKNIIIGLGANYIIGKYFFSKSPIPVNEAKNYFMIFQPKAELAAGIKHAKALFTYSNKMYSEKYTLMDNTRQEESYRQDKIGFGLRIGSNYRNPRTIFFDISYLMTRRYDWAWSDFNWSFQSDQKWGKGILASLWIHNAVRIDAEVLFKDENPEFYGTSYSLGIKYNLNRYF